MQTTTTAGQLPWNSFNGGEDEYPTTQDFLQPFTTDLTSSNYGVDLPQMLNFDDFTIADQMRMFAPSIIEPSLTAMYPPKSYQKSASYSSQLANAMSWPAEQDSLDSQSSSEYWRCLDTSRMRLLTK
jgi:hypothetical protein